MTYAGFQGIYEINRIHCIHVQVDKAVNFVLEFEIVLLIPFTDLKHFINLYINSF